MLLNHDSCLNKIYAKKTNKQPIYHITSVIIFNPNLCYKHLNCKYT